MSLSLNIWNLKYISKFTHNCVWAYSIYKTSICINSKFCSLICLFIPYSIEVDNCCVSLWINRSKISIERLSCILISVPSKECLCSICECFVWKCECCSKLRMAWIHSSSSTITIVVDSIFIWIPLSSKCQYLILSYLYVLDNFWEQLLFIILIVVKDPAIKCITIFCKCIDT